MTEPTTNADAAGAAEVLQTVLVIQSSHVYRDLDNHPACEDKILEEEGWFAHRPAAEKRCDELNDRNRRLYDVAMAREAREVDAKIRAAKATNREAAILRANGIPKQDVPVPAEFVPVPFERYTPAGSYTTYDVVEIPRSDHDGIAPAGTEPTTTAGVAVGTA